MFQNTKKRAQMRAWPILAFCGPNGSGKTAAMVWATLPSLDAGRTVLSTVRLLDFRNPRECEGCDDPDHTRPILVPAEGPHDLDAHGQGVRPMALVGWKTHMQAHPAYRKFSDWQQLLDATNCDILMDEVTGVGSSRESASMPAPVANKLVQLRRADVVVRWSAPAWARADKIIRECSQAVVYAQGYMPKDSSDGDRQWRERRMFKWALYDASDFEDFTSGKREQLSPMLTDWHWGPKSPVFQAYDTYDSVSTIGTVTDAGSCYRCGGRRSRPMCKCPDHRPETEPHGHDSGVPAKRGAVASVTPVRARAGSLH